MIDLLVKGLEGERLEDYQQGDLGKRQGDKPMGLCIKVRILLHVDTHQRSSTREETPDNQVDGILRVVDVSC